MENPTFDIVIMDIYFDTCCLQRPLDDRTQPRINVEAEAILTILGLIEKNYAYLISSEVLEHEISLILDEERRTRVEEILNISSKRIIISDEIERLASQFIQFGIKPMDALHVACAINSGVDYFCTADDRLLKKAKTIETVVTKMVSPLELLIEVVK